MKYVYIFKIFCFCLISSFLLFEPYGGNAQSCDCSEFIYLNEDLINTTIKFRINADGSLTEMLNPTTGGHWAVGITVEPHGVAGNANGSIYVGNNGGSGGIDKYDCQGNLVEEDFIPIALGDGMSGSSGYMNNLYVIGNTIYMNGWRNTGYNDAVVFAYDVCTTELIGTYTVCDDTDDYRESWDFHIDEVNNLIYINNYQSNGIAVGDLDTYLDGPCVPLIPSTELNVHRRGIVVGPDGSIYVRNSSSLTKYDSNYVLQYTVPLTSGGSNAWGIVYSETTGNLYLSGNDADCVSIYNPDDGSYLGQGAANPGDASKAISILKECCPTSSNVVIDTVLCQVSVNDSFAINSFFDCDGLVCGTGWQGGNAALTYNDCDNAITVNDGGCTSFTLQSESSTAQCGVFSIALNVCAEVAPVCINRYGEFTFTKRVP